MSRAVTPETGEPAGHSFATAHLRADLGRRALRGGALTLAGQTIRLVVQVGSTILLARLLPPADFGLIAMVVAVTGLATLFGDLGLAMATVQRAQISQAQVSTLFWINVAAGALIAAAVAALAPAIAWFYGEPRLTDITLVLAVSFLFGGVAVQHKALLQRQMRFGALVALDLLAFIGGIATAIALAARGAGYWALVASPVVTAALTATLAWVFSGWRPGLPSRGSDLRALLSFGGHLTGFNLINYAARNLDNILIGWWWGAPALGLYDRAYKLLMLPVRQINQPISQVGLPVLARLQDNPARYRQAYLRILGLLLLVTLPGVVFALATAEVLIPLALGPQWASAVPIFWWLGLAALQQPLSNTAGWLFISQGRSRELLQWGLAGGSLSIMSFCIGLPWGPSGVAAAYAVSGLVIRMPLLLWWVTRRGPVRGRDMLRTIVPFAIAGAASATGLVALREFPVAQPMLRLALALVLSYALSLCTLAAFPQGRQILRDGCSLLSRPLRSLLPAPLV